MQNASLYNGTFTFTLIIYIHFTNSYVIMFVL